MSTDSKSTRGGIQVFQGEGVPLDYDIMSVGEMDDSVKKGLGRVAKYTEHSTDDRSGDSSGTHVRCLFRGDGKDGFSLVYGWFKSGFMVAQHSHSADCLYYIVGGTAKFGTKVLRKGEGLFVPADTTYSFQAGPEGLEILEFRNVPTFDIKYMTGREKHWDRMIESITKNRDNWPNESVPPSERYTRKP